MVYSIIMVYLQKIAYERLAFTLRPGGFGRIRDPDPFGTHQQELDSTNASRAFRLKPKHHSRLGKRAFGKPAESDAVAPEPGVAGTVGPAFAWQFTKPGACKIAERAETRETFKEMTACIN